MKHTLIILEEAEEELKSLDKKLSAKAYADYKTVLTEGIDKVWREPLGNKLFEIKSNRIRSLYMFHEGNIIIIGLVFLKKSQKTPRKYIDLATKRIKKYKETL